MRRITLLTNPDICNLHCPLCFGSQRGQSFGVGEMPLETAIAAIEKYNSLDPVKEVIPSTIGEPLLYSKFKELLDFCRSKRIPLNLTTNGTFPGEWSSDEGMTLLLENCSDIKLSYMGFEQVGESWKQNVERLANLRSHVTNAVSLTLQVTLHQRNIQEIHNIVDWAASIQINRIKWNSVVFLNGASQELRRQYSPQLSSTELKQLQQDIQKSCKHNDIRCEGSLFFASSKQEAITTHVDEKDCPFAEEIWILPNGELQNCPNPERRFGDPASPAALCQNCPMRH